jgi:diguanylate cyclase (GGDEF)-like protein
MNYGKKEIAALGFLDRFWTVTNYNEKKLNVFAKDLIRKETQTGIQMMTLVFFCLLVMAAFLDHFVGLGGPSAYAYLVLAVLCLHVLLASRHSQELDVLYLLAISLLMISSTTLVLLAHKSGSFSPTFYAGVALIFIFIPFVPWGMREASLVSFLIYLVITLSILSSNQHFPKDSIILVQFFMLSIAFIVLAMVGKNTDVRRNEIIGLFGLQKSHAEMQLLSYRDPLTDIWNRRYLQEKFYQISIQLRQNKKPYYFVLFDIDEFKQINDTYGHDYGDHILQWTAESFGKGLGHGDYLFRLGGDEFALIIGKEPLQCLHMGLGELCKEVEKIGKVEHDGVAISMGMATVLPDEQVELREIYKKSDKALYAAKRHKGSWLVAGDVSAPDLDQSMNNAGDADPPPGGNG